MFELGWSAWGRNRTTDTGIFSPLLYRLSYPGVPFAARRGAPLLRSAGLEGKSKTPRPDRSIGSRRRARV